MKMKKKGFTLIELLATIIILGLLVTIAYISVTSILNRGNDSYYESQENMLVLAGREYFADHRSELPKEIGDTSTVTLETLIKEKYIDPIKDKDENVCDEKNSGVTAQKITDRDFQYYGILACGNYTTESDKAKPTISFNPNKKSSEDPITVTMKITDNEKVESYRYEITKDGEEYQDSGYQTYDGDITINLTELGLYRITGYAIDSSGNTSTRTSLNYSIYDGIDCSNLKFTSDVEEETWSNKDVNISVVLPENSYRTEVSVKKDDGVYESYGTFLGNRIDKITLTENGKFTVKAETFDKDNKSCVSTATYNIDKTKPRLQVELKKKANSTDLNDSSDISSLSNYSENTWYNGYVVARASCSDSISECEVSYKVEGASSNTEGFVNGTTRNINADGTSTITFRATDSAGNITEQSYTIKLDRTAPVITSISGNPGCIKSPNTISINLTAEENGSGVNRWQYGYSTDKMNDYANSASTTFTTTPFSAIRQQNAYFRVYDNVGNASTFKSTYICIQQADPDINFHLTCGTECATGSCTLNGYNNDRIWYWNINSLGSSITSATIDYSTPHVAHYWVGTVYGHGTQDIRESGGYAYFELPTRFRFSRSYAQSSIVGQACTPYKCKTCTVYN